VGEWATWKLMGTLCGGGTQFFSKLSAVDFTVDVEMSTVLRVMMIYYCAIWHHSIQIHTFVARKVLSSKVN